MKHKRKPNKTQARVGIIKCFVCAISKSFESRTKAREAGWLTSQAHHDVCPACRDRHFVVAPLNLCGYSKREWSLTEESTGAGVSPGDVSDLSTTTEEEPIK